MSTTAKTIFLRRRVAVDGGVALNIRDWSGNNGPVALLIHGSAEGGFVWDEFAPELAKYCRVVDVDLRGHGRSDHDPDGHYTLEKHTQDIRRLLDEFSDDEIVLIGHSLGGDVAAKIAPELGERLRALVIVDAGPDGNSETSAYLRDLLRESHRLYGRIEEYAEWLKERRVLARPDVLERLAAASLIQVPDGYRLRYDAAVLDMIISNDDDSWWFPALRKTTAPVLIVRGVASASLSRQAAEQMRAAAPRGELAIVQGAGHAVVNDNVDGFACAVLPFLARTCSLLAAQTG